VTRLDPPDELAEFSEMFVNGGRAAGTTPDDPERRARQRRRRRTGRIVALIAGVVVLALLATYALLTLTAPVGAATASVRLPDAQQPSAAAIVLPQTGEAAVSVAGADEYLGPKASGIFASSGGNAPLPMASISKLITTMVVLEAKPLGASGVGSMITFDKADAALYDKYFLLDATIAAMPAGSRMTEHDAIETMLVVSACNYAEAVADWAFGSNAAFLSATRTWVKAHGLNSTTMVEPTGIDARNTSTPSDLIALGKLAMANPVIASIVAKTSLDVPSLLGMPNTNDILGVDGVDGIKTGTLDEGFSNLLFSALVTVGVPKPLKVTGVILGGSDRASVDYAVHALLASIGSGFHDQTLGTKGQVIGSYSTPWGATARIILGEDASVSTWSSTPITASTITKALKTGSKGTKVGSVTWTAGPTVVTVPLELQGKIDGPDAWWRLTHPFELLGSGH
jgi:D-alanyl-D-alanine carboxypeptidase (penicillin-binding protein 5/6)